jgi:hypothetical protein
MAKRKRVEAVRATVTITIADTEEGFSLKVESDPPFERGVPMTGAQQIAHSLIAAINGEVGSGIESMTTEG